jgi:aldehyde:ferredoxin oxidoreductase
MEYLYGGKILRVDLTTGKINLESSAPYAAEMLGGKGIGAALIYEGVGPEIGALDPENMLCICPGLLSGAAVTGSRAEIVTKSPETGNMSSSSFGGHFAPEVKYAGYDAIVIQGRSEKPVTLFIHNDRVEIRDAGNIWGKDTYETPTILKKELGDQNIKVLCIGQAGENGVIFSCIRHGPGNAAGRGGMGAVMGSKNLKAIAVRGTKGVRLADPVRFAELNRQIWDELSHQVPSNVMMAQYGYALGFDLMTKMDEFGIANFQRYIDPPRSGDESAVDFAAKYLVNRNGCFYCPVRCMEMCSIPGIGNGSMKCEGYVAPLYMTDIRDYHLVWEVSILCQRYGIDVTSFSGIMSWCMELYQRGIIDDNDTDGIPLLWGNRDSLLKMLHKIVNREGFGAILAKGLKEAIKIIGKGSEEYALAVKGLTVIPDGHARWKGFQLGQAVSMRYDYTKTSISDYMWAVSEEFFEGDTKKQLLGRLEDVAEAISGYRTAAHPEAYEGKGRIAGWYEDAISILDMVGQCKLTGLWVNCQYSPINPKMQAALLSAGLGKEVTEKMLFDYARKVRNYYRAYEMREGDVSRDQDTLPKRLFGPVTGGRSKGEAIDRDKFEEMKSEYYEYQGWDVETGLPTRESLDACGLKKVADDLQQRGKLSGRT